MSKAVPQQSTPPATDSVHVPLLQLPDEGALAPDVEAVDGEVRFHHPVLVERVFTAAGEVESAEWTLDQVLDDAAESDGEIGVGFDVEPVDAALESARWALDQAVCELHRALRQAASHGVALAVLAEASGLGADGVRAVLAAAEEGDGTRGALAPAV
ncbi:hypothetical protein ACH9EU_06770 [Kocuria sp. M1R5S2]|uniref:hypothetical protein n=1 Tax=Kocuria rhizosphaerae TaxID=3376285 RepID=UPI0037988981